VRAPDDNSWSDDVIAAALVEARRPSDIGSALGELVQLAEVLARTLARVTLVHRPELSSVLATLEAEPIDQHGILTARVVAPPRFKGYGPTLELETWIAIVDSSDRVVGDICFFWAASSERP
jgi:hypothetical protein